MGFPTLKTSTALWFKVEMDVRTVASTGMNLFVSFSGKANHDDVILSLLTPLSNCPSCVFFIYGFPPLDVATPQVFWSLLWIGQTSAQYTGSHRQYYPALASLGLGVSILGRRWDGLYTLCSIPFGHKWQQLMWFYCRFWVQRVRFCLFF